MVGRLVSSLVGIIGALWLAIAGGAAVYWWDRRPPATPSFKHQVLLWKIGWTAPDSLQAQLDRLKAEREAERRRARGITQRQAAASAAIGAQHDQTIAAIRWRTKEIIRHVPIYVSAESDDRYPVPWGVVRLHDAAALGVDPATLPNPAGEPDDAASSVAASDLARAVARNYGDVCRADAAQLADLQAWVRAMGEAQAEPAQH